MDDTALAAPELGADGTDQGFIKWFKALPQVRWPRLQRKAAANVPNTLLTSHPLHLAGAQLSTLLRSEGKASYGSLIVERHTRNHRLAGSSARLKGGGKHVTQVLNILQDFYSVHGENAVFIAKSFYKTTAVVKTMGSSSNSLQGAVLPSCR